MSPAQKKEFATLLSEEAATQRWVGAGLGAVGAAASTFGYKVIAPPDPEPMANPESSGKLSRRTFLLGAGQLGTAAVAAKALMDVAPKLPEIVEDMNTVSTMRKDANAIPESDASSHKDDLLIAADKAQLKTADTSLSALKDVGTVGASTAAAIGLHKVNKFLNAREVAQQTTQTAVERAMARAKGDQSRG